MRRSGIITQNKKMLGFVDLTQRLLAIVACLTLLGSLALGVRPAAATSAAVVINDSLSLDNVTVSYETSYPSCVCCDTNLGTFQIFATFSNTSSDNLSGLYFDVVTLTGGNQLCNADSGAGGEGSSLSVTSALGVDGVLNPGESFTQSFDIGLASLNPFQFFVDVYGEVHTYVIGDTGPAGGKVFYFFNTTDSGAHGLEAAPADQGTHKFVDAGCYATEIQGADGTAIGTGKKNTADILAGCTTPGIAARVAATYVLGDYADWFLPSQDELAELYLQRTSVDAIKMDDSYWSSTDEPGGIGTNALSIWFGNGQIQMIDALSDAFVRPIREF